jgi:hypothetical protein
MSVVRTPVTGYSSLIREHWTAETEQELRSLYEKIERNYPKQGYGTTLVQVRPDATGLLWHAEFSRFTSCD